MAKSFLNLPQKDQAKILNALSLKIGRSASHLEKDIWLCLALQHLFSMPNRLPMAFKGGTSLSKVFDVIHRFSEDIDITIDYQAFKCDDPFASNMSKTQLKNLSEKIKSSVTNLLKEIIVPSFEAFMASQFKNIVTKIELAEDGETIFFIILQFLNKKANILKIVYGLNLEEEILQLQITPKE